MIDSRITEVKNAMPPDDDLFEVAELFKAFGDLPRAKIICALSESELCVSDLTQLLEMNQSAVSHQLRMLKQMLMQRNYIKNMELIYLLVIH